MAELRVCHIVQGLAIGQGGAASGAERLAVELAGQLPESGLAVTVCSLRSMGGPAEEAARVYLKDRGVEVVELNTGRPGASPGRLTSLRNSAAALPALAAFLRRRSFDVVHTHAAGPDLLALPLRPLLGRARLVRTAQNERELAGWPLLGGMGYGLLAPSAFHAEVGVSREVCRALDGRPGARLLGRRSVLIHNAIDLSRFAPAEGVAARARTLLGLSGDGPVLGAIGRLVEQKGHTVLLRAMAVVLAAHPSAVLLIIGEGPLRAGLESEARALGLGASVRFLGARTDVERLLPGLDVLVSASLWEGLSIVLLEAMAAGVPVVATDVSGSREVLEEGSEPCGLVAPPGDAAALAAAVLSLLDDPGLRQRMAAAGMRRARQYDIAAAAREYAALYSRLAPPGKL